MAADLVEDGAVPHGAEVLLVVRLHAVLTLPVLVAVHFGVEQFSEVVVVVAVAGYAIAVGERRGTQ